MATYRFTPTIKEKKNYKEIVQLIIVNDEVFFSSFTGVCDCKGASFRDEHHDHTITGDLRLIVNTKRKSFLSKGPIIGSQIAID